MAEQQQESQVLGQAQAQGQQQRQRPKLHGYDLRINEIADYSWRRTPPESGSRPRFANALSDWSGTPLTLRERTMIAFMGDITDKPDWMRKIADEDIVSKWRLERAEQEEAKPESTLSELMFDYCLEELQDYAKYQQQMGFVPAVAGDAMVFKSDSQISNELNASLRAAVAPLEDVPDEDKDWHPASDDKVLDLVHPSLFPLIYGRTRILPDGDVPLEQCSRYLGKGEVVPVPGPDSLQVENFSGLSSWHRWGQQREAHFYSANYQWLPCQVDFGDNESTRISSYINSLHPKTNKPLYEVLEKIIARTIPMWDATLTATEQGDRPPRIDVDGDYWIEPEGKRTPVEGEDEETTWELDEQWQRKNRVLIMPEPGQYSDRAFPEPSNSQPNKPVHLRKDFATQGLQIIVKLANIHLTPEKPQYDGGTWHIEGQLNEHICASAIYYYDSQNVTDSQLSFREPTSVDYLSEKPYEQDDHEHFERLYGIENQGPATQVLGQVKTKEGRLLTFPNIFQHRVSSFSLVDQTRPGHRKILALFLVDPYTPIPSTAHVPPQQKTWWRDVVMENERVAQLPAEVIEMIVDADDDYAIDLQEAKRIRLELMEERKMFVADVDTRFEQEIFHFCEH